MLFPRASNRTGELVEIKMVGADKPLAATTAQPGVMQGQGLALAQVQITPQRRPESMVPATVTPRHQQVGTNLSVHIWSTYTVTSS